ncbi:MAG TPA: hypothetical protein DIT07_11020, partial [Sphingobacteriaceae bacterium]|nr:hypothetical protein [Sphingobacteriaceae bacterium]
MLREYFKIAWRNILKRKFYTLLNISGLSLGMSCCMLIYLYSSYQLSFDTYHHGKEHIFRLVNELKLDKTEYNKGSSIAMLRGLQSGFPQIEKSAVSIGNQSLVAEVNNDSKKRFREEKNVSYTNSDWFKLFQYEWISGGPEQLDQPGTAVLTKKLSEKYFGNAYPIDKIISIAGQQMKVVGVIKNPANTDLKADMYLSISSFPSLNPAVEKSYFTAWGYIMTTHNSFVYLKDPRQKAVIEKELVRLENMHISKRGEVYYKFRLLPLEEMHFDTRYAGTIQKSLLTILALIGTLILVIAGINYINLVIAQQARRSAEIGTRKVLGGSSKQLFMQFMTESLLISVISVAVSLLIVISIIPFLNRSLFAEEPLQILSFNQLYLFAFAILAIVSIGAGLYPAYLMSRVNVLKALKNNTGSWVAGLNRKSLVVIQNVVAQVLIICTIIIVLQVHFLKNTDKGFNRESVLMIPFEKASDSQRELLSQRLKSMPDVQSFSFCYHSPGNDTRRGATVKFDDRDWEPWPARFAIGDSAYCKTFGLKLIAGRNIVSAQATPEYLVNEMMASRLYPGHPEKVVGKKLSAGDQWGIITGVVKDFNIASLVQPIEPSVLLEDKLLQTSLAVKLSGRQTAATLKQLDDIYKEAFPDQVFSYQFVDDQIAQLYKKEELQQKFIRIAAGIAIIVSSLGLLGLISLMTLHPT